MHKISSSKRYKPVAGMFTVCIGLTTLATLSLSACSSHLKRETVPSTSVGTDTNTNTDPGAGGTTETTGAQPVSGGTTVYKNLAPAMGQPLDLKGTPLTPAPPDGWVWYEIDGAICRDGSPTGFYVRYTDSDKLIWYLEGGGACTSSGFCSYNQANLNEVLSGDQETCMGSVTGIAKGRQQPGNQGIFDTANNANPVKDWNMIYVPYCTGDIHFGTLANATVPGLTTSQNFVGYHNMLKFTARIVPTFKTKIKLVLLAGSSAGGFGAALNYSMVQDSFGSVPVKLIDDSGVPFDDAHMPVCMQKRWRQIWGLDAALPSDCKDCQSADGGGLAKLTDFLLQKHPNMAIGLLSSVNDEIMRDFYAMGDNDCANFENADPITDYLAGACVSTTSAGNYAAGLDAMRKSHIDSGKFAAYFLSGSFHQHLWRSRFYEAPAGNVTIAQWLGDFIAGKNSSIGP